MNCVRIETSNTCDILNIGPIRAIKMAKNALLHCNRERSDIDLAVSGGGVDRFEELLERGGYCMQKFENFVNSF
jgi:hypothetical protein